MRAERGFTLVETLVALVIVAVALPALLRLISTQIDGMSQLRAKVEAQWVADYVQSHKALYAGIDRNWDADEGSVELLSKTWGWYETKEETSVDGFFEYRLQIHDEDDNLVLEVKRYGQ